LAGADVLLKNTPGQTAIADKAYDVQVRRVRRLLDSGKGVMIARAVRTSSCAGMTVIFAKSATD
jgi:methionine synthase I (cobalamin-dependent)